jgi:hypothetical protein
MGQDNYKKYLRYKWELLRRNKNYQADCKTLPRGELWQKWGAWLNPASAKEYVKINFPVKFTSEDETSPEISRMIADILEAEVVEEKHTRAQANLSLHRC